MSGRGKFKDLTNKRINMFTVIKQIQRPKIVADTGSWWLVRCDCGKYKNKRATDLTTGNTKSCGCMTRTLMRESRMLESGLCQKRTVFGYYKSHSKKIKKPFTLSFDKFIKLTTSNCFYCGNIPMNISKSRSNTGDFIYNGIDRLDNSLGYTSENCVSCCKICNIAKNKQNIKEFYSWIKRVHERIKWGIKGKLICLETSQ